MIRRLARLGRVVTGSGSWLGRQPAVTPSGARFRYLAAGVLVVLAAGATSVVVVDRVTALPEDAAFRVAGEVVTEGELDERVKLLTALYGLKPPTDPAGSDRFKRDTAKAVAVSMIVQQAAQQRGVVVARKEASDQLTKLIENTYPQGRQQFVSKLGQLGVSQRQVVDAVRRQMTTARLYEEVTKNVEPVTDEQVRQAYTDRKQEMVRPEQRHLRNIVVGSRQEAAQLLGKLRSGGDFAELARGSSLDGSTKAQGGDLGWVTARQLASKYGKAAFGAKPDSFFGPVQTKHGWNVGQVLEVRPSKQLSFEQVRDRLRAQLTSERKLEAWNSWLAEQIKEADVTYAQEYRPDNPDAPPPLP